MVLFNYSSKELTAKIVYYGPGLGGKTTSLEYIYKGLPAKVKGKMLSLSTQTDRTLFFDFLPMELGKIYGWRVRVQLYTVPGQVFYDATRKIVLKGADGVVFVCDSQNEMLDANIESWQNFQDNLKANNIDFTIIPLIFQYNKRDIKNITPVEELETKVNTRHVPYFETIATEGNGVLDALKAITKLVLQHLQKQYNKVFQEEKREAEASKKPEAPAKEAPLPKESPLPKPATAPKEIPLEKTAGPSSPAKTPIKDEKKPKEEAIQPKELKTEPEIAPEIMPTDKIELEQYEELSDEDIVELPVKDEELNLDADSWQQIEIGRLPELEPVPEPEKPIEAEPEEIPSIEEPEIEEIQELQFIKETDEIFVEDTPKKSADRLSDTWKAAKSKVVSPPAKPKPTQELKDKTVEITAPISKEDTKLIELLSSQMDQKLLLPVEIKIDTEKGIMNITLKITLKIKKD